MSFNNNIGFINPYTFVPTDFSSIKKSNLEKINGSLTGVLNCRIITKTPIAIPDIETREEEKNGHTKYRSMKINIDGKSIPFIPGSSIRGMIRSVYETMTDSCYSTVDKSEIITYRNAGTGFEPGILEKTGENTFKLWKADRYIFKVKGTTLKDKYGKDQLDKKGNKKYTYKPFNICSDMCEVNEKEISSSFKYGEKVYFTECNDKNGNDAYKPIKGKKEQFVGYYIGNIYKEPKPNLEGLKEGLVCIGEPFDNVKHFESVFAFAKDEDNNILVCESGEKNNLSDATSILDKIVNMYNDETINSKYSKDKPPYENRHYDKMKIGDSVPIWYKISENKDYKFIDFSVADLGRSAYGKNMGQLLGRKKRCETRENACETCGLFGLTGRGEKTNKSAGSRLRFTDAISINECELIEDVTLKELASPKTSYLPFYSLVENNEEKLTRSEWSYNNDKVILRGRKFYWHNLDKNAYKAPKVGNNYEKTKRNSTMELIDVNSTFSFSVYYDSITEEELEKLKWVITLGVNSEEDNHCHKIGHGKPIGLGSIKIVIDENLLRKTKDSYRMEKKGTNISLPNKLFNKKIVDSVCEVTTLDACKYPVMYPYVAKPNGTPYVGGNENKTAAHVWFKNNFPLGNKKPENILPRIGDQNKLPLPVYELADDGEKKGFGEKKDNKKQGKISSLGKNKNNNEYGEITIEGAKIRFYADTCKIYAKLKVGDIVTADIRKNKNNDYYTAFNVQIIQDKN